MQFLATAELMQHFDNSAIHKFSVPGILLMENAGRAFTDVLEHHVGTFEGKSVLIICGKGNNGGDGFVIARHLSRRGAKVQVLLLGKKKDVKGDAKTNLDILLKIAASNQSHLTFEEVASTRRFSKVISAPAHLQKGNMGGSSIIVDAIFGTGFQGEVNGLYRDVIHWINQQQGDIASVDIPSGVNSTTGVVENIAVNASLTITMGFGKIGHYVGDGREHSGTVEVVDIGIPNFVLHESKAPRLPRKNDEGGGATFRVEARDVKKSLPKRPLTAHKYSVGTVLVIAGSRNFTGAPLMAAASAMRAGAGAVVLAVPASLHSLLVKKMTEVMLLPLDETEEGTISLKSLDEINKRLPWADVVAMGPGLSQNLETRELVHRLVQHIRKPLVLDADALSMIAHNVSLLKKRTHGTILTPHAGELRLLTKLDSDFIEANRVEAARSQAKRLHSVLVLKGSPSATGTCGGNVYLNPTGNPGMATAGSGDVLTGIISSFLAQGMLPEGAAYCGVFVHGLAGDIAATKFGERGMMAMDILDCIPEALKTVDHA